MSNAWEVTVDDVKLILDAHGSSADPQDVFDNIVALEDDRIEDAVLYHTDFDDQVSEALSEIENVLIENGLVEGKKYDAP